MKEKSPLKPKTTPNTEISGPPCTFLICVVTSRVNDLKYVLFFLFCFVFFVCNNIAYALAVLIVKTFISVFFFFLERVIWLACFTIVCTFAVLRYLIYLILMVVKKIKLSKILSF